MQWLTLMCSPAAHTSRSHTCGSHSTSPSHSWRTMFLQNQRVSWNSRKQHYGIYVAARLTVKGPPCTSHHRAEQHKMLAPPASCNRTLPPHFHPYLRLAPPVTV